MRYKVGLQAVPLALLVEDSGVYPRHTIDEMHVTQLVYALQVGAPLPAIIAELTATGQQPGRIVDGVHRARAYRRTLGAEGVVDCELRRYQNDEELIFDAVRLNAQHGRKLDRMDQARAVLMMDEHGASEERIALALHLPAERIIKLRMRVATVAGKPQSEPTTIVLKRPVMHLSGEELTEAQAAAMASVPGTSYLLLCRQLISAMRNGLINASDERLKGALDELRETLSTYLAP